MSKQKHKTGMKVLILDIETTPLEIYSWGIYDQTINPGQIIKDWSVLSWSACWLDEPNKLMYEDTRKEKDPRNDKNILKKIHSLMDEADIILGQNSNSFDLKKLNTRFVIHGMKPPSSYRKIDTKRIAKKHFAFTTASLDFMTKSLNSRQKKMHNSGLALWIGCLNKQLKSFKELERYNKQDVKATLDLFKDHLQPWDNSINPAVYLDVQDMVCMCGSKNFARNGFCYTSTGKYQRYACKKCGSEAKSKKNLIKRVKE